jgi:hypothetical protein
MFEKARAFLLSLTIIAVLVFSAVGTTVVYADGETPPDAQATEAPAGEKPGTVTVDTVETKGDATPVPTVELAPRVEGEATPAPAEEAAPPKGEAAPAEEAGSAPEPHAAGNPADKPILDSVPENTTVAVVNAEGVLQPLATEAAADAIATSDPIWCPAGQAPTPGLNGCTQSFNSFTALLTFLAGNASFTGPGTIYVEQGNYQGGESVVDFNNFNLTNISNADLSITGGWNTSDGTTTSTSTFNNVSFVIGNSTNPWGGTLTISNLTIDNPTNTGITVHAQGNINVSNVAVTNSTNGAGAELNSGNDVNINNSRFERNKTAGAIIRAVRDVSVANSSFSNPANARRQIVGLDIITDGSVSLLNVIANENREAGATIDAAGSVSIENSTFNGTKAIVGSNFLGYGLTVVSQDVINLNTVTANDNFLWGAMLTATGDVSITNSIFNANTTESPGFIDDTGLLVFSQANVSIANSHADDNRLIGAVIEAVGDVSISNSTFNSNNGVTLDGAGTPTFHGYGLQAVTDGSIFIDGVTASGNTLFGAHLEAGGNVLVANSDFSNQTSGDANTLTGRGLEIVSGGNALLQNVTLNNNQTFGADIQAGGGVLLENVTADGNGTTGVELQTNCGTLILIGGTYQNNGQYGLSILNTAINQIAAPVFANNTAGNIFNDPGTCVFSPSTPPTTPPVYQPNDPGAVAPRIPGAAASADTFARSAKVASGALDAYGRMATLNSFLAAYNYSGLHIGPFTGKYAYVYLSSGMQIVAFDPSSLNEFAMNGS